MLNIRIEGLEQLQRRLANMPEQFNRATAAGINRTARAIEQHQLAALESSLDRPTPFTMNAIQVYEARPKPDPSAIIQLRPLQARYLIHTIRGARLPVILEPINIRLNRYGNIVGKSKGLEGIAAKGARRFVATINGTTGVWERARKGRGLKLLVRVARNVERKPRWDFYGVAERVARDRLTRDVSEAVEAELRR